MDGKTQWSVAILLLSLITAIVILDWSVNQHITGWTFVQGNESSVTISGISNFSISINNSNNLLANFTGTQQIIFLNNGNNFASVLFNFDNNTLNLSTISFEKQLGSLAVQGLTGIISASVEKRGSNYVCIKNSSTTIASISNTCTVANEFLVACNASAQAGFVCTENNSILTVTGANSFAVQSIPFAISRANLGKGANVTITISGQGFSANTQVSFNNSDIVLLNQSVLNSSLIRIPVYVRGNATKGSASLTLNQNNQTRVFANVLNISDGPFLVNNSVSLPGLFGLDQANAQGENNVGVSVPFGRGVDGSTLNITGLQIRFSGPYVVVANLTSVQMFNGFALLNASVKFPGPGTYDVDFNFSYTQTMSCTNCANFTLSSTTPVFVAHAFASPVQVLEHDDLFTFATVTLTSAAPTFTVGPTGDFYNQMVVSAALVDVSGLSGDTSLSFESGGVICPPTFAYVPESDDVLESTTLTCPTTSRNSITITATFPGGDDTLVLNMLTISTLPTVPVQSGGGNKYVRYHYYGDPRGYDRLQQRMADFPSGAIYEEELEGGPGSGPGGADGPDGGPGDGPGGAGGPSGGAGGGPGSGSEPGEGPGPGPAGGPGPGGGLGPGMYGGNNPQQVFTNAFPLFGVVPEPLAQQTPMNPAINGPLSEFSVTIGPPALALGLGEDWTSSSIQGLEAVSEAVCSAAPPSDDKSVCQIISWTRGFRNNHDEIIKEKTGFVMNSKTVDIKKIISRGIFAVDLEKEDVAEGVVDGRINDYSSHDEWFLESVEKKVCGDGLIELTSVAQNGKEKDSETAVVDLSACEKSCSPTIELFDLDGSLQSYPNPCCSVDKNIPSACCTASGNFQTGKLLTLETSQCVKSEVSLFGAKQVACMPNVVRCDARFASGIHGESESIYKSLNWVALGQKCDMPFNPFMDSFTSNRFGTAVDSCSAVELAPYCVPGTKKIIPNGVACSPTVWECIDGYLRLVDSGQQPSVEVCDNADNDCDGKIDEDIICSCSRSYETKACFSDKDNPVSICVKKKGIGFEWDTSMCAFESKKIVKIKEEYAVTAGLVSPVIPGVRPYRVAELENGKFALSTPTGFVTDCGSDLVSGCFVSGKTVDGPVVFSKVDKFDVEKPVLFAYNINNCDNGLVEFSEAVPPVQNVEAYFTTADARVRIPATLSSVAKGTGSLDMNDLFENSVLPEIIFKELDELVIFSDKEEVQIDGLRFLLDKGKLSAIVKNSNSPVKNKGLVTLGQPLEIIFSTLPNNVLKVSAPLVLKRGMDPGSLGAYVWLDGTWEYIGGELIDGIFFVDIQLQQFAVDNKLNLLIAGSACVGCKQAYLYSVREVNSDVLLVLAHGFLSSPRRSMSALLYDIEKSKIQVDVALFGYGSIAPEEASDVLGARLRDEIKKNGYKKVVFVAHSLGGLIIRDMLQKESWQSDSLLPFIDAVILSGTPNRGTPIGSRANNVFDIFAKLIDFGDVLPVGGVHKDTLNLLSTGVQYNWPESVKLFVHAGNEDLFGIGSFFRVGYPNDALVSRDSAQVVGDKIQNDVCVNWVEQESNHFGLNKNSEQRYSLLYFLRELSDSFRKKDDAKMYVLMQVDNCQSGLLEVYGTLVEKEKLALPEGCEVFGCGDSVCQLGESCAVDCAAGDLCDDVSHFTYLFAVLAVLIIILHGVILSAGERNKYILYSAYVLTGFAVVAVVVSVIWCELSVIPAIATALAVLALIVEWATSIDRRW